MTVIKVEGIGKRFRVGHYEAGLLSAQLGQALRNPLSLLRPRPKKTFWALKDISFEVKEGEVLGLIGRNGAGKSTLLKILARITKPTLGEAEIHGRVGSLLEVGTGFHHELSGRENVFLNGAILGMGRREITRKFDEIVAFAEVEKFIDTPVKHYSSGMYIRLAFAVAAHLETDILFVDEVLSVGDVAFQKKCLGKMDDVAHQGRTIIFISHQMNQIRRLCHRVIWLDAGDARMDGPAGMVLGEYESAMHGGDRCQGLQRASGLRAQFVGWEIAEPLGQHTHVLTTLGPTTVTFRIELAEPVRFGEYGVALFNAQRQLMWARSERNLVLKAGTHAFSHSFATLPLRPGGYQWQVSMWDRGERLDLWDCLPEMMIATEVHQHHMDEWNGVLNLPSRFVHRTPEDTALEQPTNF